MESMTQEEMKVLPHVVFYKEAVEDREATIREGHHVSRDVDMVKLTPRGCKDCVTKEVGEWFEGLKGLNKMDRLSHAVLNNYQEAYATWQKGEEIPEKGLSIKLWPVASPAQVKTLIGMHVYTVEQLAAANEQIISGIGMHGRLLVQRAQAYLKESANVGQSVMQFEKQSKELETAKETIATLLADMAELKKLLPAKEKA